MGVSWCSNLSLQNLGGHEALTVPLGQEAPVRPHAAAEIQHHPSTLPYGARCTYHPHSPLRNEAMFRPLTGRGAACTTVKGAVRPAGWSSGQPIVAQGGGGFASTIPGTPDLPPSAARVQVCTQLHWGFPERQMPLYRVPCLSGLLFLYEHALIPPRPISTALDACDDLAPNYKCMTPLSPTVGK